ncbi:SRPBCC family protein [Agromyces albus]|uniref:SRPBCC domain-containing protein n=1 Tax=Agromyces albus TaxID=205332 RepID=A0A4Q2L3V0_9MICO|nr:SRPBCC domain-containing protein [Agromyces albus]RXZ70992.1 SRPBCC domain-containing protein [Agromyces albus]
MTDTERPTGTRRRFSIVRHLDAPRELVFRAWTDPAQLHWFAGVAPSAEHPSTVDLRIGGAWRVFLVEQNDEARSYVTGGVYREIVEPSRLVFSWGAVGGWPPIDPEDPDGLDRVPIVTIELEAIGDTTRLRLHFGFAESVPDARVREWYALGVEPGMNATIDRLAPHLARA